MVPPLSYDLIIIFYDDGDRDHNDAYNHNDAHDSVVYSVVDNMIPDGVHDADMVHDILRNQSDTITKTSIINYS
jgi:hypothetical protein